MSKQLNFIRSHLKYVLEINLSSLLTIKFIYNALPSFLLFSFFSLISEDIYMRYYDFLAENKELANLPFPPWLCQPYVRIPPEQHIKKCEQQQLKAKEKRTAEQNGLKRPYEEEELTEKEVDLLQQNSQMGGLSKKKAKKLLRNPKKKFIGCRMDSFDLCVCRSPRVSFLNLGN